MEKTLSSVSVRGIATRFAHILSAQVLDGIVSALFFLYLAWLDSTFYGELMYAIAVGGVVKMIAQYGLYYPMVSDLSKAQGKAVDSILNQVNVIKLVMLSVVMPFVLGMALFGGLSPGLSWVLVPVALGCGLEAFAETFFADLRVRGRQDLEARARIIGVLVSYGYGFAWAAAGLSPFGVSCYRVLGAVILIVVGAGGSIRTYLAGTLAGVNWHEVVRIFRDATVFALIQLLGLIFNKTNIFFLERVVGVKGVAFYSATYNIVDPICVLASEQFLGFVIFPLLAGLWNSDPERARSLIRVNAVWLMALAFPIMFALYVGSDLMIGLLYPAEYKDAVWMQKYLVWTTLFSFESNLFCYVMMVAGAANVLLAFSALTTCSNLLLNVLLVYPYGLAGGCLVIVLSKLVFTLLSFGYCQFRWKLFKLKDFLFPVLSAAGCLAIFLAVEPMAGSYPAGALVLVLYGILLWKVGVKFLGALPYKIRPS